MAALGLVADDAFAARLADMDLVSKSLRLRFDLDGTDAEKLNCAEALLAVSDGAFSVRSHQDMAVEFYTMYGGFLFLGIFLGLPFLLATVLIIYYKQVSEGYEDQRRYQIMQQVGMSPGEVALSIRGADSAGILPAAADSGTSYLSGISLELLYFGAVQPVCHAAVCPLYGGDAGDVCRCVCHGVRSDGPHLRAYCGRHRVSR